MYRVLSTTGCITSSLNTMKTASYRRGVSLTFAATVAIAAQAIWLSSTAHAQTPTSDVYAFTNLSSLANLGNSFYSAGTDISNGVIVGVGSGSNTNYVSSALRWNTDGTVTNLHNLANLGNNASSSAMAVSNGVAVGSGSGSTTNQYRHALRWNANGTVTDLHALANLGNFTNSSANDIVNGVTVGNGNAHALRWNANGTVTDLNSLITFGSNITSNALSIESGVTVGFAFFSHAGENVTGHAIRWNADNTVTDLELNANLGTQADSGASAISNGVIVGDGRGSNTNNLLNALRWKTDSTVTNLHSAANLGSNSQSSAADISGGVTVGQGVGSNTNGYYNALRWNADGTALNLHQFTNGFNSSSASGIDSTGIIVGSVSINKPFPQQTITQAATWTPLNAGAGGANSLFVRNELTTTINRNFTQSAGQTITNGTLAVDDANAGNGAETFTLAGGTLGGAGTLAGNLVNTGGIVSPGNSPGTLTVNGDYTQSGSGVLKIEIASLSDFDVLHILGNASIRGTLDIAFLNAYEPLAGDSFDFLQTDGGLAGAFDTIHITGGNFDARKLSAQLSPSSGGNGFSLAIGAVVPESGSIALLALALPMMGTWIARRRNK